MRPVPLTSAPLDQAARLQWCVEMIGNISRASRIDEFNSTEFGRSLLTTVDRSTFLSTFYINTGWLYAPEYGVKGDNSTNDTAAINSLFALAAADERTVFFPDGNYVCGAAAGSTNNGQLNLVDNLRVVCSPRAKFIKNFRSTGNQGFISQGSMASAPTKLTNVRWDGGMFTVPDTSVITYSGNIFALYGDDIVIDSIVIDGFGGTGGGRAFSLAGDRITLVNPVARNPNTGTGNGGVRFLAGDNFRCFGGYIESGDDALQFVPGIRKNYHATTNPFQDQDITNSFYIGTVGRSYSARLLVAAVGNQTSEVGALGFPTCQASIKDSGWVACSGRAGARAALVQNTDSSGVIRGLIIDDCLLGGAIDSSLTGAIYVNAEQEGGGIENLKIDGPVITDSSRVSLYVDGRNLRGGLPAINAQNVRNVTVQGGRLEAPNDASANAVTLIGVDGFDFDGTEIIANGNEGIKVGAAGVTDAQCYNVGGRSVTVRNVADGQYGWSFQNSYRGRVHGGRVISASGATTAGGVLNHATGGNTTLVDGLDLTRCAGSTLISNPFVNGSTFRNVAGLAGPNAFAYKTANTTRTNTATLANDPHLAGLVAFANSTYKLSGVIEYDEGGGGGNWQFAIVLTGAGAAMRYSHHTDATAANQSASRASGTAIASTALNRRIAAIEGYITTGANAATVDLQWAQNTSNATGAIVLAGSWLKLERLEP